MIPRPPSVQAQPSGFSLIELLIVVAIIGILSALAIPAIGSMKGASNITKAAYDIAGVLEQARSYAMANNTYVWVGFYEENTTDTSATTNKPPYTGVGRVVLTAIASRDGTTLVDDSTSGSVPLPPAGFVQIGKISKIENIHLGDLGAPPVSPSSASRSDSLDLRSGLPYDTALQGPVTTQNRICSDNSETTSRPFTSQNYTFYKTIRFSPRGEANINSTYKFRRVAEIGLKPTRGTIVDTNSPNVVAIQITGIAGRVNIYRR